MRFHSTDSQMVSYPNDIYDPVFVEQLFDKMSTSYSRMNVITSFGFSVLWRRQCVAAAGLKPGMEIVDLMSGMGEAWEPITQQTKDRGRIIGVDFCRAMLRFADRQRTKLGSYHIEILCENALQTSIPNASVDAVISTFGLKTFSPEQLHLLAREINRILKPGGVISMVEISQPRPILLRMPYLFYLKICIPLLGKLFLDNPSSYRMLGEYTERFGDCSAAMAIFKTAGLQVEIKSYFFGCATGIVGKKQVV